MGRRKADVMKRRKIMQKVAKSWNEKKMISGFPSATVDAQADLDSASTKFVGHSQEVDLDDSTESIRQEAVYHLIESPEGFDFIPTMQSSNLTFDDLNRSPERELALRNPCTPKRNILPMPTRSHSVTTLKPDFDIPDGRRLIALKSLSLAMNLAARHGTICNKPNFTVVSERRVGLRSRFEMKCHSCKQPSFWVRNDDDSCNLPVNDAAVWATNVSGSGFALMEQSLAVLDIPFLSRSTFSKMECEFSGQLNQSLQDLLKENGKKEAKMALDLGQFEVIEGVKVPWTDVYGDGQWSKRCYNQAGTANSGSACLIGFLTGQPLFVGVRNKFCLICKSREKKPDQNAPPHTCYKNWTGSSSAMEADIIAEGFRESMRTHGIMYKRFVGDGDSNVFHEIRLAYHKKQTNFVVVEKIECKNHAIRRMNVNLLAYIKQKAYPPPHRRVLADRVSNIGKCCNYVIHNNIENRPRTNASTLKVDLMNVLPHVFGDHKNCKEYNCRDGRSVVPKKLMKDKIDTTKIPASQKLKPTIGKIKGTLLWHAMMKTVNRLASHSVSLMYGITTNIAESFQSHMNKVLQGRRINFSHRGGYNRKTAAAAHSFQYGQAWYRHCYKNLFKRSPSKYWKKMDAAALRAKQRVKKPRARRILFKKAPTEKYMSKTRHNFDNGDQFYGEHAQKVDMEVNELQEGIEKLKKSLDVANIEEQWKVHCDTVGQWDNPTYRKYRCGRLTSSICGRIFAMRDSTSNVCILDSLLEPTFTGNEATAWGKIHEYNAIKCYEKLYNCKVDPSGLFISLEDGFLAASPDGLVGHEGIVEVKCPFLERFELPENVSTREKNKFMSKVENRYVLSTTSHYYYQVVMQLHVTQRKWCDFIVWTLGNPDEIDVANPKGHILVERIYLDTTKVVWNKIYEKLVRFWQNELAPEIVDSRPERTKGYRQPEYRLAAMNLKKIRDEKRQENLLIAEPKFVSTEEDKVVQEAVRADLNRGTLDSIASEMREPIGSADEGLVSRFCNHLMSTLDEFHSNIILPDLNYLENMLRQYDTQLRVIQEMFKSRVGVTYVKNMKMDYVKRKRVPKAVNAQYALVKTPADNSCFYNAVSLSLFGNVSLMQAVRLIVLIEFVSDRQHIIAWLKQVGFTESEYLKLIKETISPFEWASDRHIWICSKVISRPIFVYTTFNETEMAMDSDGLARMFETNRHGLLHSSYKFHSNPTHSIPICMLYTPVGKGKKADHFVALVQRSVQSVQFQPQAEQFNKFRDWSPSSSVLHRQRK